MDAVILDYASLGSDDLDRGALLAWPARWTVHASTAADVVAARIAGADILLVNKVRIDRAALAAAPRLRLIVVLATGVDNVDLEAARERGIAVCNVRGYAGPSVAQHVLMLVLALARNLPRYQAAVAAGAWSRSPFFCLLDHPLVELAGRRFGIVGYGDLGRATARLATALGMEVLLAGLPGREHAASEHPRLPLEALLPRVDVLSLHCPLTPATRGLIGARELALLPPHALLVNTARGGIVDEDALLDALRAGRLGGAALDTLAVEPPPSGHPLLVAGLPNLIVTPHIAWASREARQRLLDQVGTILAAWRAGAALPNRVV